MIEPKPLFTHEVFMMVYGDRLKEMERMMSSDDTVMSRAPEVPRPTLSDMLVELDSTASNILEDLDSLTLHLMPILSPMPDAAGPVEEGKFPSPMHVKIDLIKQRLDHARDRISALNRETYI